MAMTRQFDLQDRLIDYAVRIIALSEALPNTKAGRHVSSQILRSGTSPAPNYGEAQSAESKADFVHKLKVALKELRETEIWLKVISKAKLIEPEAELLPVIGETDELIAILYTSVVGAKKRKEPSGLPWVLDIPCWGCWILGAACSTAVGRPGAQFYVNTQQLQHGTPNRPREERCRGKEAQGAIGPALGIGHSLLGLLDIECAW